MPDIQRVPVRMNCDVGLDLVHPVDRMPPGSFQKLTNARVLAEGRLDGRPGYTEYGTGVGAPKLLHSIRRLNDPDQSYAAAGYTYVVGNGTVLDAGVETALTQVDTGYSGNPLSLLPFRPESSSESWMYVYDENKLKKVRPDGTVLPIGYAPPNYAPTVDYGVPASAVVADAQTSAGWGFAGATTGIATTDRLNGVAFTISAIQYNSGTTGWACLTPSAGSLDWAGVRAKIILSSGPETVVIREMHPAITSTTISAITYDSGTTGLCSMVLANSPAGLARNSLIRIAAAENVRVLAVVPSQDGTTYSIRCSTVGTRAAGNAVAGLVSWYVYTVSPHTAGETITANYISASQPAAGTGAVAIKVSENSSNANGRPIDTANDYLHISMFFQNPQEIAEVSFLIDVDPATPAGTAFTNNYYQWILSQAQIGSFGSSSGNVWVEIVVPISEATRHGSDMSLNLSTVQAVGVALVSTGACAYGFDWWYLFGTYGPVIQPNAPSGYQYCYCVRDSSTGAASVPGPAALNQIRPLREAVIVTPPAISLQSGVNYNDIYRQGGTLTDFLYIGSVADDGSSFTDGISDATVLASNAPAVDLTLLQPWPILATPWTGVVNVVGTSVSWVSGTQFNTSLVSNSVILLNGKAYLTRGQPKSATFLEINASAGVLTNATYSIASPTIAGQPMPLAFGPLEGPFAPVAFALGSTDNSGTLYFTNTSNLDAAADTNTLELCGPTEPLVTGEVWNGFAFAGSRDNVFLVRYAFSQDTGAIPFQYSRLPGASGFWSRWAICRGPNGIYALGRDGIYRWTEQGGVNISDAMLYPLFPHDGQAAAGANGYLPVDMSQINFMRLSAQDNEVRFVYLDTGGNQQTLRYEVKENRWFHHNYADPMSYEYLDEPLVDSPNTLQILQLSRTLGSIYVIGGNTDNGTAISSVAMTPYFDGGDERAQKLNVDYMVDADQSGVLTVQEFYNNGVSSLTAGSVTLTGNRTQSLFNASEVPGNLNLYRNVALLLTWSGGPSGPRIYAFEPGWYLQPYLSKRITTQYINLDFPGWKHHRRLYAGLISTSDVDFVIQCQDGRQFTATIPSTGGQFLIQPIMLDQAIKDLSFAYQLDGGTNSFALYPESFTVEVKHWNQDTYIDLAVFRT